MSSPPDDVSTPFAIASYMCREYSHNATVQHLLQKVAENVRRQEELLELEKTLNERHNLVQTQNFTLETIQANRELDKEQETKSLTVARNCHASFLEFNKQLHCIDLQKIAKYDMLLDQLKMQKEFEEMIEYYKKMKAIADSMECRHIVQKLRAEQTSNESVQCEYEKAVNMSRKFLENDKKRIEVTRKKNNSLLVQLIQNSKDIQDLRNYLENSPKTLTSKQTDDKDPFVKPSTANQSRNPMNFVNSIFESNSLSSLFSFGNTLAAPKHRPPTTLLSTMHPQNETNPKPDKTEVHKPEKKLKIPTKPKHVHFLLTSDDSSEETQRTALKGAESQASTVVESQTYASAHQESQRSEGIVEDSELLGTFMCPESSDKEKSESDSDAPATQRNNYVEILESRIVKPAGSPLPKVLPVSLSPRSQQKADTSKHTFKTPQSVPKKSKSSSPATFFEDFMGQSMAKGQGRPNKSNKTKFLFDQAMLGTESAAIDGGDDDDKTETETSEENAKVYDFESDVSVSGAYNFNVSDSFPLDFMEGSETNLSNNFL